ncbi:MAG: hypothetical protein H6806_01850 [Planctomycetes bacterium]|nr:hypothetical protein [Planctomycetota bacterium]MCB9824262.1 hypothetical protein [Planctomycetota bacterium]MCB9828493.1 hypothetical protein [Planctomycetota bacterium]MCB9900260.1 hypothetical protein [Planctomycetota bacterium]
MSQLQNLVDVLGHECDIVKHLVSRLPEGAESYRPSEGQRSTLELLRYLTYCGIGAARWAVEGDVQVWKDEAVRGQELTLAEIPDAMDRQKHVLADYLGGLGSDEVADTPAKLPWGVEVPLGRALLEMPLKWMTAYRMQLFLYAKAAGAVDLTTADNWRGAAAS